MASITDLAAAGSASGSDELAINQSGTDRRITVDTLQGKAVGSWTPTVTASSGTAGSVDSQGEYRKYGDMIHCWFHITLGNKGTLSGDLFIGGLPYTIHASHSFANASVMIDQVTLPSNTTQTTLQLSPGTTTVRLVASGGTAANSALQASTLVNGSLIRGMFSYVMA